MSHACAMTQILQLDRLLMQSIALFHSAQSSPACMHLGETLQASRSLQWALFKWIMTKIVQ